MTFRIISPRRLIAQSTARTVTGVTEVTGIRPLCKVVPFPHFHMRQPALKTWSVRRPSRVYKDCLCRYLFPISTSWLLGTGKQDSSCIVVSLIDLVIGDSCLVAPALVVVVLNSPPTLCVPISLSDPVYASSPCLRDIRSRSPQDCRSLRKTVTPNTSTPSTLPLRF